MFSDQNGEFRVSEKLDLISRSDGLHLSSVATELFFLCLQLYVRVAWTSSDVMMEPVSRAAGSATASETVLMAQMKSAVGTVCVVHTCQIH